MSILILVRHGQSVYNLENRLNSRYRFTLGRGRSRAGEKLKDYKFEIAYTSMLIRAKVCESFLY
jgi:2,3-bisphosphoglycerate-dependent phosphoglycerate mutase